MIKKEPFHSNKTDGRVHAVPMIWVAATYFVATAMVVTTQVQSGQALVGTFWTIYSMQLTSRLSMKTPHNKS